MEQKYVICPWCQQVMYPIQQVIESAMNHSGTEKLRNYYYECDCGARSPEVYGIYTHEEAVNAIERLVNFRSPYMNNEHHTYLVLYIGHDRSAKVATDTFVSCSTGAQLVEDAKAYLRDKLGYDNIGVWNICKLD